jgi:transposase
MGLAVTHPTWVLGFEDEVWFSRFSQPNLHAWSEKKPLRLVEQEADKSDPDPKALACYGLLRADSGQRLLRFVQGRPVSTVTIQFLVWLLARLAAEGQEALLLIWDNASWHSSNAVRSWVKAHNRKVKAEGGCRLLVCPLPSKSPWLNNIESKWMHGKRAVVEPARTLMADELKNRLCDYYGCELLDPIPQYVP